MKKRGEEVKVNNGSLSMNISGKIFGAFLAGFEALKFSTSQGGNKIPLGLERLRSE